MPNAVRVLHNVTLADGTVMPELLGMQKGGRGERGEREREERGQN
jgi:hypothetical protein